MGLAKAKQKKNIYIVPECSFWIEVPQHSQA